MQFSRTGFWALALCVGTLCVGIFHRAAAEESFSLLERSRPQIFLPVYSDAQKRNVAIHAFLMMRDLYAHREEKMKTYGVGVDSLPLLQNTLSRIANLRENAFHEQVSRAFLQQRDLHLRYTLPAPHSCYLEYLPLNLAFAENERGQKSFGVRQVLALPPLETDVKAAYQQKLGMLSPGDEIVLWDGLSPWAALAEHQFIGAGANAYGAEAAALWRLTLRNNRFVPPPVQNAVALTVRKADGSLVSVELPWILRENTSCVQEARFGVGTFKAPVPGKKKRRPILRQHDEFQERNAFLRRFGSSHAALAGLVGLQSGVDPSLQYGVIENTEGHFGYLHISSFVPQCDTSIDALVQSVRDILTGFSQSTTGLIIDVRDNGGGMYGDQLVQMFVERRVEPQTEAIRASAIQQEYLDNLPYDDPFVKQFVPEVHRARALGQSLTQAMPINPVSALNNIGTIYRKPVVILMNANCYSYCDYFTTAMQDHEAALVWGENGWQTGGGGATVFDYADFLPLWTAKDPSLTALSGGQSFLFPWSEGFRSGKSKGIPIEDAGARADRVHNTSLDDLRKNDASFVLKVTEYLKRAAMREN